MNTLFIGITASAAYGALGAVVLFNVRGAADSQSFLAAYTISFKTLSAFGLILGTALVVSRSQGVIPQSIEAAFSGEQLSKTQYSLYKRRFHGPLRSVTFAGNFIVVAFVLFSYCRFPLSGPA
jgi:hypothetical protein